jgi:hypothetical protein
VHLDQAKLSSLEATPAACFEDNSWTPKNRAGSCSTARPRKHAMELLISIYFKEVEITDQKTKDPRTKERKRDETKRRPEMK